MDFLDVVNDNLAKLKDNIREIKINYPNIDSDPDSHDGSYELVREIIKQYKNEINNSSKWGAEDVNALYYATTFVKNDTKIEKISKTHLKEKEELKQLTQELNKKFINNVYTNNIDEASDIGMFKNVSGGFGSDTKANATEDDLKIFIKYCTDIIDETDSNKIYEKFETDFIEKIPDKTISMGILSQILHCLKPNCFPVLNSGGLRFYQKALNIKMQSKTGRTVQINGHLGNYIKVIKAIKECNKTQNITFNNFRVLDLVAQIYYCDFDDINSYFKYFAGTPSPNRSNNDKNKCQAGHGNFKLISKKINKNNFECEIHRWNNGQTANNYFWAEYKSKKFKNLPYSISFFAEEKNMRFRIDVECKGTNPVFSEWIPEKNIGFDDFDNNTSKLVKIFNGPFNYANSRITIEQIQDAFSKLEPEYNKLCNIAIKIVPATESAGESGEGETMQNFPLNQILYGPPGTGKTYNTVVNAMEIIGLPEEKPDYIEFDDNKYKKLFDKLKNAKENIKQEYTNEEYKVLKQVFDKAKEEHQIEFITFHQSYSYEEFVEGIKPYIPKDIWKIDKDEIDKQFKKQKKGQKNILPDIKYIGQKGIFKEICERAEKEISFDETLQIFKRLYPQGSTLDNVNNLDYSDVTKIKYSYGKKQSDSIDIQKTKEFLNKNITFKNGTECQKAYDEGGNVGSYHLKVYNKLSEIKSQKKPYILIIDEINRGNISKIFGELITLIEEDKRKKVYEDGKEYNTIKVTLPYSQDTFSVPNNLYIIGTMNTADRSIANVDIALRRRFKFVEMMPQNDIVADFGCNFGKVFEKLNKRIAALLDRDHQIGHSYFIKDKYKDADVNTLKDIWFDSVMPLLNEYFYGDWEKLQAILGKTDNENTSSFIEEFDTEKLFASENNPCDNEPYYDFRAKSNYYGDKGTDNFRKAMKNAFDEFEKPQE